MIYERVSLAITTNKNIKTEGLDLKRGQKYKNERIELINEVKEKRN